MLVLLVGNRKGLREALGNLKIDYILWSAKPTPTPKDAVKVIIAPFPKTKEELSSQLPKKLKVTHVIAGTEAGVIPASQIRLWRDTRRNPHSIVLKCADKLKMKEYLQAHDIEMTEFIGNLDKPTPSKVIKELGTPLIAKPRKSSGGRGIKKIRSEEEISQEINRAIIFEKAIKGSEGSVESLIVDGEIQFTNITQYKKIGICNLVPAHYQKPLKEQILDLNKRVIETLKIKWGMTHLEFYNTKEGLLFGEIALRPPGGYILKAMEIAYGRNFWDYFVRAELGLKITSVPVRQLYASSYLIYPKIGVVKEVKGEKKALKIPSLQSLKLKLEKGTEIEKRIGVGQDYGHAIFANEDAKTLASDIATFEKTFTIIME